MAFPALCSAVFVASLVAGNLFWRLAGSHAFRSAHATGRRGAGMSLGAKSFFFTENAMESPFVGVRNGLGSVVVCGFVFFFHAAHFPEILDCGNGTMAGFFCRVTDFSGLVATAAADYGMFDGRRSGVYTCSSFSVPISGRPIYARSAAFFPRSYPLQCGTGDVVTQFVLVISAKICRRFDCFVCGRPVFRRMPGGLVIPRTLGCAVAAARLP